MKHALITGGAGFIGSNLAKNLLKKGYRVTSLDNLITSTTRNCKDLEKNRKFEFIKHDITIAFSAPLEKKLQDVSEIFHLACPTGVPNLVTLGEEMLATCSIGTQNIVKFAVKRGTRLLFTSSSEVYGNPQEFPQKESYTGNVNPTGVRSTYEEGKRFSESIISLYVRKHNLNARIVRVFNTYGPGMSETDTRVIPRFLRLAKENKPLPVEGDGSQTRTFCYVDDLVNGLLTAMKKGARGEVYNLGGSTEITILELAKLILFATGSKSNIEFVERPSHDHARRHPDLSKIQSLGWKQTVGIYEGLKKTLEPND